MKNPCYTKTDPLRYEEFEPMQKWWNYRKENEHAWKITIDRIAKTDYNFDIKNPNKMETEEHRQPDEIIASLAEKERRIVELVNEIQEHLRKGRGNDE
jgi:type I restriction enzyme M protein